MHPNAQLIQAFYAAFARRDAEAMVACYHPEVEFSDPVFPMLRGERAGAMWRMLCQRAKDLRVEASDITADAGQGRAHWDAWYTFSATGRMVHNTIAAEFTFRDGLIVRHRDQFDLWRWSSQALGVKGKVLGWTPMVRRRVQADAARGLDAFIERARVPV